MFDPRCRRSIPAAVDHLLSLPIYSCRRQPSSVAADPPLPPTIEDRYCSLLKSRIQQGRRRSLRQGDLVFDLWELLLSRHHISYRSSSTRSTSLLVCCCSVYL